MANIVIMPKFGQTVEDASIVKWHKNIGDKIKRGDILLEIETDKAVLEVESFFNGVLLKIGSKEGDSVPVMSPIAIIGEPGEPIPELKPIPRAAPAKAPEKAQKEPSAANTSDTPAVAAQAAGQQSWVPSANAIKQSRKAVSPRARALAIESAIGTDDIIGTGAEGRVVEKDVLKHMSDHEYESMKITPAAKDLARREKIDILKIDSRGGRITIDAITQAIAEKPTALTKIRQVIADRMTMSYTGIPHFFVTTSVDMTDLLALRKELKKDGKPFSVTDFILKAVALALVRFPVVNSFTDGKIIKRNSRVHLGMAVAIKDGLVVPVIRDAHDLSLKELHVAARDLADKARNGKLAPDEMTGSTFTISNMGMLNVENFTAIINPGESAILAISSIRQEAVVIKNKIEIRSMMKMTLSSDHRIIDGAVAANFINEIKKLTEDIETWKRMIS